MSDNYIVSARKYRPDSFGSIVGQGAMAGTLRSAVQSGRLAHAYLFCGPRGVGKTTAARVLAKTINCTQISEDGEACEVCDSCRAFEEQRSFNIFELDAASNNSVEDIRTLIAQVSMPPVVGRYKVYIIDEVHMLSASAFNAFLKTLEEPPAYAVFILATTEKHKILPTILSRCQIYDFRRITVSDIAAHLRYVVDQEGILADDVALGVIAEKADGGMRDALSMLDRVSSYSTEGITYTATLECLNVLDHTYYTRFVMAMRSADYRGLLLLLDEVLAKGFDGQFVIGGLAAFFRDLLVAQHPDTLVLLEKSEAVAEQYRTLAREVPSATLYQGIKALVACDQQYRSASNKRLLVELALLSLLKLFSQSGGGEGGQQAMPPQATTTTETTNVPSQPRPPAETTLSAPTPPAGQTTIGAGEGNNLTTPLAPTVPSPPANIVPTPVSEDIAKGRKSFRASRYIRSSQRGKGGEPGDVEGESEGLKDEEIITEESLRRAWQRFLAEQLSVEQLIEKRMLEQELPRLVSPSEAEYAIPDAVSVKEKLASILPLLQDYLRRELRNGKLILSLKTKAPEERRVALTTEEKYSKMVEEYPNIEEMRRQLGLRLD